MAKRRMFSLDIVDTDKFLDMPQTAQNLYFHLGMRADDEGFIASPRRVMTAVGSCPDDLALLAVKGYLLPFNSGVYVIRHWKENNSIRADRVKPTFCIEEKRLLALENGSTYTLSPSDVGLATVCQPSDNQSSIKCPPSIGKVRSEEDIPPYPPEGEPPAADGERKSKRFVPPTTEEVTAFCQERGNGIDPQAFIDHYAAGGWKRGNTPIKDWRACVRTWEQRRKEQGTPAHGEPKQEGRVLQRWD